MRKFQNQTQTLFSLNGKSNKPKNINVMFENDNFIWKFRICSNLLFGKSKNFKFGFKSNSTIVFKVVKVEDLRVTIQTLSFSKSSIMKILRINYKEAYGFQTNHHKSVRNNKM